MSRCPPSTSLPPRCAPAVTLSTRPPWTPADPSSASSRSRSRTSRGSTATTAGAPRAPADARRRPPSPPPDRPPPPRLIFAGANPYILTMLQMFGDELGVTAGTGHFQESLEASLDLLKSETAEVALEDLELKGARLSGQVVVENLAGHKFPTAYPSRRARLHITVHDADGLLVFESGAALPDGSIDGNDNDADPAQFEPHYQAIVGPHQVQIYEAILKDSEGAVTTSVMRAAGYLKDNRLLAGGVQKSAPHEDIAVRGEARDDPDFVGGGDRVLLDVPLSGTRRVPYTVTVEVLFQPLGDRWIENLRQGGGAAGEAFLRYGCAL